MHATLAMYNVPTRHSPPSVRPGGLIAQVGLDATFEKGRTCNHRACVVQCRELIGRTYVVGIGQHCIVRIHPRVDHLDRIGLAVVSAGNDV